MVSPYLTWWIEEQEREMQALEKARRLKKLKIAEASLCTRGANPGAVVTFWKSKSDEGRAMFTEAEVDNKVREYLKGVAPHLDYNTALQKHFADPGLQDLYALYPEPQATPVRKAADDPGEAVWLRIQKLARELRDERPGALSEGEAIEEICFRRRPDLYERYREATMG